MTSTLHASANKGSAKYAPLQASSCSVMLLAYKSPERDAVPGVVCLCGE